MLALLNRQIHILQHIYIGTGIGKWQIPEFKYMLSLLDRHVSFWHRRGIIHKGYKFVGVVRFFHHFLITKHHTSKGTGKGTGCIHHLNTGGNGHFPQDSQCTKVKVYGYVMDNLHSVPQQLKGKLSICNLHILFVPVFCKGSPLFHHHILGIV